jgi:hypothetical protein
MCNLFYVLIIRLNLCNFEGKPYKRTRYFIKWENTKYTKPPKNVSTRVSNFASCPKLYMKHDTGYDTQSKCLVTIYILTVNRRTVGEKSQICNRKLQPTPETTYISSAHAKFSPTHPRPSYKDPML